MRLWTSSCAHVRLAALGETLTRAVITTRLLRERRGNNASTDNILLRLATMTFGSSALTCGAAVILAVLTMIPQSDPTYFVRAHRCLPPC